MMAVLANALMVVILWHTSASSQQVVSLNLHSVICQLYFIVRNFPTLKIPKITTSLVGWPTELLAGSWVQQSHSPLVGTTVHRVAKSQTHWARTYTHSRWYCDSRLNRLRHWPPQTINSSVAPLRRMERSTCVSAKQEPYYAPDTVPTTTLLFLWIPLNSPPMTKLEEEQC